MAHLLAIESAGATCSVALARYGDGQARILAERALPPSRGQADRLIELIEVVLDQAGLRYTDLDVIVLDRGPGSFTGVRSGLAAARGLALATRLPLLPLSSLECLAGAARARPGAIILAAIDARRGEVYAQAFDAQGSACGEPFAAPPANVAQALRGAWHLIGSGAPLVEAALPEDAGAVVERAEPDASLVAQLGARKLTAGAQTVSGFEVEPLYLRAPDARPQAPVFGPARAAGAAP